MRLTIPAVLLSGTILGPSLSADSVRLAPVADTTLFAVNPDFNLGAEEQLIVGGVNKEPPNGRARTLTRFDLPNLPLGAVITNITFELSVLEKNPGEPAELVGLHRVLKSWNEGNKSGRTGQLATSGEATWLSRAKGSLDWAAPGGLAGTDFVSAASTTQTLDAVGRYTFGSSDALIADVQAWRTDPTLNFGWILVSLSEATAASARRIGSRELAGAAPVLVIEFSVPVPAPEIVLFDSIQRGKDSVELRFHAAAGNIYSVWYRAALGAAPWLTLTNLVSKLVSFDALVIEPVNAEPRFYQLAITGQVD